MTMYQTYESLETDRILFFRLENKHVTQNYVDWLNDREINQYLESRYSTQTLESVSSFVEKCLQNSKEYFFGIYSKELKKHIGNIRIHMIDYHHGTAEVGILIGEKASWGHGYASEALMVCSKFCREQLKLRKLTAGCYGVNLGSRKAFLKSGYEIEGLRLKQYRTENGFEDLVLMGALL